VNIYYLCLVLLILHITLNTYSELSELSGIDTARIKFARDRVARDRFARDRDPPNFHANFQEGFFCKRKKFRLWQTDDEI
jgi:hypothetical protein